MNTFVKAEKHQAKLRMAIDGPSGSGKTYTALVAATALANGGKIAVIDTEHSSASLYSDRFAFDVATLEDFNPENYIKLIKEAEQAGYSIIVIDSLSHAWEGKGGALDMVEAARIKQRTENSFTAWKDVTPVHRELVDAMLQSKAHIIATMRSKTDYVIEQVVRDGRTINVPKKIGLAPVQRAGMEYEFTIVGEMDLDHNLVITKSRMESLADQVQSKPDVTWFGQVVEWLNAGVNSETKSQTETKSQPGTSGSNGSGKPDTKAWGSWNELVEKAKKLGIKVEEQPKTISLDKLREEYKTLAAVVKAVQK